MTGETDLDAFQRRIREKLRAGGSIFVRTSVLRGWMWLMSPRTSERDPAALVPAIREAAR